MARLGNRSLALLSFLIGALFVWSARATHPQSSLRPSKRLEAAKRWEYSARTRNGESHPRRSGESGAAPPRVQNITFTNPKAEEYYVNGATIPEVNFDVGPSWAGLIPISDEPNETRKLFFWFLPPGPEGSLDDLIFWTNGGPGCSSLEGLLKENGPFLWRTGNAFPIQNEWSWTNLSSVLYVEQPIGTGFSQGTPTAKNEEDVAAQLVGFLQQFLEIFAELKGKKFYVTGESYAGMYVPYLANYIYENTTRATLDLDLQGIWINDGVIDWIVAQSEIPAVHFVHKYEHVFAFNQTFLAYIDSVAAKCNYADYMEKHVKYPPDGPLPLPGLSTEADPGCDVWVEIANAALLLNPAFDVYRIFAMDVPWDVLGFPNSFPDIQVYPVYFDRQDVKMAIHAPLEVDWTLCQANVFVNDTDTSLPSGQTVLPNVIEKSKRSVIVHGLADFILIAEGTRVALQNMTWNGLQGFQKPIVQDSFIVDGIGALGNVQSERGLTYVEIQLSGHMVPENSPQAAFQIMQYLLGTRDNI